MARRSALSVATSSSPASSPAFKAKLDAEFDGVTGLRFNLAPPLFAKRDPVTGHLLKREFGPWMGAAMGWLARFKGLRGTALDDLKQLIERLPALTEAPLLVTTAVFIAGEHGPISMIKEASASARAISQRRRSPPDSAIATATPFYDIEKAKAWIAKGAQPTDRVARELGKLDIVKWTAGNNPTKGLPGRKANERAEVPAATGQWEGHDRRGLKPHFFRSDLPRFNSVFDLFRLA